MMRHYISLGAGVQSSTVALMAAVGELEPMPAGAIFADTQAEPSAVYRWLDWLEARLPFPVHRVTAGNLREAALTPHVSAKGRVYYRTAIPFHTKTIVNGSGYAYVVDDETDELVRVENPEGETVQEIRVGKIRHRTCTRDYKIRPITKALRRLASVPRGTKEPAVCSWIGISADEMQRMKPAREPWIATRWPLIERRMTRGACLEWMRAKGYPQPPRSACTFCPFRSNREWRHLKRTDPEGFADAVAFDHQAREVRRSTTFNSEAFVHRSLMPLDQVDLRNDTDRGQLLLWQDECSGMCGV